MYLGIAVGVPDLTDIIKVVRVVPCCVKDVIYRHIDLRGVKEALRIFASTKLVVSMDLESV